MMGGIAHPHRLAILYLLAHEPMWPEYLGRHIPIPQNLIAHHLKVLRESGWLKKYKEGRHTLYAVDKKYFKRLPKLLLDTPLGKKWFA